jgi:hypothetical protein
VTETIVAPVTFELPEYRFRFYRAVTSIIQTLFRSQQFSYSLFVPLKIEINFYPSATNFFNFSSKRAL